MSHYTRRAFVPAAALSVLCLVGSYAPPIHAASPSDQARTAPEQLPAKPMVKKEPMMGEMKKDGMLKEDVSKAAQKWGAKMDESMKQEKMK
jgi:hypothetical protein